MERQQGIFVTHTCQLPGGLYIQVQVPGNIRYTFDVQFEQSVKYLKELVSVKINKPVGSFDLRNGSIPLDERKPLNECEVSHNTVLILVFRLNRIKIFLQAPDGLQTLEFASNAKVSELRAQAKRIHRLQDIGLVFIGKELEDEERFDDAGITENSVIDLVIRISGGRGA